MRRIASSKMLPSENHRAICDVTFVGAAGGPEESAIVTAHSKWEHLKIIYPRYHRKHAVRLRSGASRARGDAFARAVFEEGVLLATR